MSDDDARRQQIDLYGDTVASIAQQAHGILGVPPGELADLIGLSEPMLGALVSGTRVRIGNQIAIGRLVQLQELIVNVRNGLTPTGDVSLALAQIRASTLPAVPGAVTHPAAHAAAAGPGSGGAAPFAAPRSGPQQTPPYLPPGSPAPAPGSPGAVPAPGAAPSSGGGTPPLLSATSLGYARSVVARHVPTTPTYRWPLLEQLTGTETWVKHENHTPIGAFKVRGGLNFVERLRVSGTRPPGLISATRGNHGQSLAFAGRAYGLPITIVVPEGNSPDKNVAITAMGAELIVHGADFQAAAEHAAALAAQRNLMMVPPFHPWLVEGVATAAAELHEQVPGLDVVYVPVGMGSGICAQIAVRDLLGARTEVVGVVAANAPAYARSVAAGRPISTESADTFVDGVACRTPDPHAVAVIRAGASRILEVSEEAAAEAMALMYRTTHNLAEPAGSLALAGLLADRARVGGRRVAIVHTGGNCDHDVLEHAFS
ncbi:threonine dehydratase [Nocardioides dubius]|uniref:Tryptophan synthase beta chain-like PALP domain-containing protein n=1 Tax=Nocardioides dubius TaxID=317019 RepID=A0ABP4E8P4_9ACTN